MKDTGLISRYKIQGLVSASLEKAMRSKGLKPESKNLRFEVFHPALSVHGDYTTNAALVLFQQKKVRNKFKSLFSLANFLADLILQNKPGFISEVKVVGGFINFYLSVSHLVSEGEDILNKKVYGKLKKRGEGKTMIIDYSAPNIAKPFGIGHLRSTIIGQAIYNFYSVLGWKVIGDNHLGDWGTQFGSLIYMLNKLESKGKNVDGLTIQDLENLYVEFHNRLDKRPELKDEARKNFRALEKGDKAAKKYWKKCIQLSIKEYKKVYDLLGVKIDETIGESFYVDKAQEVVEDAKRLGVLVESRGAKVIRLPKEKVPVMLVKTDGATTYLSRDLATIKYRRKRWDPDLMVYEVGADQKFHFEQLFSAAQILGYAKKSELKHVAHGLIRWKEGKFSTRKGRTIHLEEVLAEAVERAKSLIDSGSDLSREEKIEVAKAVGVGGIKFNDLKQEPEKDIIFDWDKVLNLQGYSAAYLQYTYTRCFSLLDKAKEKAASKIEYDLEKEEIDLLRSIYLFPEKIVVSAEQFSPHFLAQYLFELSQKYNLFYQRCRIIDEKKEVESFRLFLTAVTAEILKKGLGILGISTLEKM